MSKSYIAQVPIKSLDAEGNVVVIQPGEPVPKMSEQDHAELASVNAIAPAASVPLADEPKADEPQAETAESESKPKGRTTRKSNAESKEESDK